MIDHFEIKVCNFNACVEFYSQVLIPLGVELKWSDDVAAGYGLVDEPNVRFLIEKSSRSPQNCHIAFSASDEAAVDAFHTTGIDGGFESNGAPGLREGYAPNYFAAFLFDPDGNNVEAVVYA